MNQVPPPTIALAGDAKASCVAAAKAKFGKT
jgi:hypothetical protein